MPPSYYIGGFFMNYRLMTEEEMSSHYVGEAISVGAVMAIACIVIAAVVILKLFMSNKGTATVPGGWKFTWN